MIVEATIALAVYREWKSQNDSPKPTLEKKYDSDSGFPKLISRESSSSDSDFSTNKSQARIQKSTQKQKQESTNININVQINNIIVVDKK